MFSFHNEFGVFNFIGDGLKKILMTKVQKTTQNKILGGIIKVYLLLSIMGTECNYALSVSEKFIAYQRDLGYPLARYLLHSRAIGNYTQ
jgi:hypothetical protein